MTAEPTTHDPADWSDLTAPVNPFKSARVCSAEESANYLYPNDDVKRGDRDFVMSRSALFEFANCPRRWKDGYRDGDTAEKDWGSLMDCLVLDYDAFKDRYAIPPDTYPDKKTGEAKPWNRNSTWCKAWEEEIANGKTVVKQDEVNEAMVAQKTLLADKHIAELILSSRKQVMVLAEYADEATGIIVPFKGLIDLVPGEPFADCLADLKTCRSAHPKAWAGHVVSYGYHWQAAIYLDAYNAATGESRNAFKHVLQESERPYYSELTELSYEFLAIGRREYKEALRLYCECLKTNKWPGYRAQRIHGCRVTEPPTWLLQQ